MKTNEEIQNIKLISIITTVKNATVVFVIALWLYVNTYECEWHVCLEKRQRGLLRILDLDKAIPSQTLFNSLKSLEGRIICSVWRKSLDYRLLHAYSGFAWQIFRSCQKNQDLMPKNLVVNANGSALFNAVQNWRIFLIVPLWMIRSFSIRRFLWHAGSFFN